MKAVAYITKKEVKLSTVKYSQDYLRVPFTVVLDNLLKDEIANVLNRIDEIGAVGIGRKKISENRVRLETFIKTLIEEKDCLFKPGKNVNVTVSFKENNGFKENNEPLDILRYSLSGHYIPGTTVYDYNSFLEISSSLESEFPLTIENSTLHRNVPEEAALSY